MTDSNLFWFILAIAVFIANLSWLLLEIYNAGKKVAPSHGDLLFARAIPASYTFADVITRGTAVLREFLLQAAKLT